MDVLYFAWVRERIGLPKEHVDTSAATVSTSAASATVSVNTVMQSTLRQAGTRPRVLHRPLVGLNPIRWLNAAGTRPDPAVSGPSAKGTSPAATATAEPELDPPLT